MAINTEQGQLIWGNSPENDDFGGEKQLVEYDIIRKAIMEIQDTLVFTKLSSSSPKVIQDHRGKKLVGRRYYPILDDRNIGTHGLDSAGNAIANQNLYGSSMNIDDILNNAPTLTEYGGRVNRIGFTRTTYEATCQEFGIFFEWTRNSIKFDSDMELYGILVKDLLEAGYYINEDRIAVDLIKGAGVVGYGGNATKLSEVTGEATAAEVSVIDYEHLIRLSGILDENKCPADTMIYEGSRNIDTRTIGRARFAFIGSELRSTVLKVTDYFGNQALINSRQYATTTLHGHGLQDKGVFTGEIGAMDNGFRFVVIDRMPYEAGKGHDVTTNGGYRESGGKYDCYPMLVVGSGSYSNLKFSADYKESGLFEINWKNPKNNGGSHDPFHRNGYYSISFSQGTLIVRPEWISCSWFVAEL
jgi:N4-gp56 family major capsid protein